MMKELREGMNHELNDVKKAMNILNDAQEKNFKEVKTDLITVNKHWVRDKNDVKSEMQEMWHW